MTDPRDPIEPTSPWSEPTPTTPTTPVSPPPTYLPPIPATAAPSGAQQVPIPALSPVTAVSPAATVRSSPRKRGLVDVVLVVAMIFAVGGVGFAVGRVTAPAATTGGRGNGTFQGTGQFPGAGGTGGTGGTGNGGGNGGFGGGGFGGGAGGFGAGGGGITISGEVVDISADHLTLKLASGQSVQIGLSGTTTFRSATSATAADVTAGSTVQVQITRGGGGGGAGGPGASPGTGGVANGGALGSASQVTVVPK